MATMAGHQLRGLPGEGPEMIALWIAVGAFAVVVGVMAAAVLWFDGYDKGMRR